MSVRDNVYAWLARQTKDPRIALRKFTTGGFIFIVGMMVLLFIDQRMPDSLLKDLCALISLLIVSIGALLALWGYLCISVFKILVHLFDRKVTNDSSK